MTAPVSRFAPLFRRSVFGDNPGPVRDTVSVGTSEPEIEEIHGINVMPRREGWVFRFHPGAPHGRSAKFLSPHSLPIQYPKLGVLIGTEAHIPFLGKQGLHRWRRFRQCLESGERSLVDDKAMVIAHIQLWLVRVEVVVFELVDVLPIITNPCDKSPSDR